MNNGNAIILRSSPVLGTYRLRFLSQDGRVTSVNLALSCLGLCAMRSRKGPTPEKSNGLQQWLQEGPRERNQQTSSMNSSYKRRRSLFALGEDWVRSAEDLGRGNRECRKGAEPLTQRHPSMDWQVHHKPARSIKQTGH
jgi:hypothetical protein